MFVQGTYTVGNGDWAQGGGQVTALRDWMNAAVVLGCALALNWLVAKVKRESGQVQWFFPRINISPSYPFVYQANAF